jgi:hypothetical protein
LQKWHGIQKGCTLDEAEKQYILDVIKHWLVREER